MTTAGDGPSQVHQEVRVEGGFGYGVIGADLHVFADRGPVYVLEEYRRSQPPDPDWLAELPSRMLNARYAVVDFTGRQDELALLRQWRDTGPRLAARWLHAPGGQGKTRLAARFAEESLAAGWKVVTATHGPGSVLPPPGSQDLRLTGKRGLLLIIDYADRWPLSHLTWLLSNALLHQSAVPARVLMLARGADAWPAVRAALANHQAGTSSQHLAALPDDTGQRTEMFTAARDSFATRYALGSATDVRPPARLDGPDFGLTLALHIAALVAVDAHATGRRPPADMANLTIYLLDREHLHWARLHTSGEHDTGDTDRGYLTPPAVMNRTVFTAALTGPLARSPATTVLGSLHVPLEPERVLTDHSLCYPPADPTGTSVLEPLYPDRLAEDFIALTLPGHTADYPTQSWAAPTTSTLLAANGDRSTPSWTPRTVTFLAAAAERWPHVGPDHLYPLLHASPELAVAAGGAALTSLAGLPDIDPDLLESIASHFPEDRRVDLDAGIAAVTVRLAPHRLTHGSGWSTQVAIHHDVGLRLHYAGREPQALQAAEQAVAAARRLVEEAAGTRARTMERLKRAASDPAFARAAAASGLTAEEKLARLGAEEKATQLGAGAERMLAGALRSLGRRLSALGRKDEALAASEEAVTIMRRLVQDFPTVYDDEFGAALYSLGGDLASMGRPGDASAAAQEAVQTYRRLAAADPAAYEPDLAIFLVGCGTGLFDQGRLPEALALTEEGVAIMRRHAQADPATREPSFAELLSTLSLRLSNSKRPAEATATAQEAVAVYRRLAGINPAAHEPELAEALRCLGMCLLNAGRSESLDASGEAVGIQRRLARDIPAAYEPRLAEALLVHSWCLYATGRHAEALAATREQVEVYRRLSQGNPGTYEHRFAVALLSFAGLCAGTKSEIDSGLSAINEVITTYHRDGHALAMFAFGVRSAGGEFVKVLDELGRAHDAAELRRALSTVPEVAPPAT
ncbi:tetratricopeptide repeat protein [Saccharopolyspora erythraea]|uniref:tetratricopeptide repeat protein n=1 Tax=Saccharopolyspora erythraea TaxID=1836 RepID=UPI001BA55D5A|nr:tetratricopeptide repeat protein [Saccharopolyspora erythraea]QUH03605.1 tetratricopeptide repeat protein [Saccharopolyspora erythraea]